MLPAAVLRGLRRWLLAQARRQPMSLAVARSRVEAIHLARWAAGVSPAYAQLLREHGLQVASLKAGLSLAALPVLDKANTFGRFSLAELARPLAAHQLADVLTSSGRSGSHFGYRLSERRSHERAWFGIDLGLEDAFQVGERPTLLVNCLPMGVVFRSRAVAVAHVSVREDMACAILRDVGPRFAQTLVCTDPLFVRRLLEAGQSAGVDWRALNTSVILGEELLVEPQRDHIARHLGIDPDRDPHRMVGSSFGVGELGLNLLFETRPTLRIRRAARRLPEVAALLEGSTPPPGVMPSPAAVFCYVPQRLCVEIIDPDAHGWGGLCLTLLDRHAVIPLPRFATGDLARLLSAADTARAAQLAGVEAPWLPVVLLRGRQADQGGDVPSVERIKALIYADFDDAELLTGAFRIRPGTDAATPARAAQVFVQARQATTAKAGGLQARLQQQADQHGLNVDVCVLAPEAFPGRPHLDFERKLDHWMPRLPKFPEP
jgi:phenylacetate-CoA ligase